MTAEVALVYKPSKKMFFEKVLIRGKQSNSVGGSMDIFSKRFVAA